MKIIVYDEKDVKKNGSLKKKNHSIEFNEKQFKEYVYENNLNLSKGYIDLVGSLSNNKKFRCYHQTGLVVGVTRLIEETEIYLKTYEKNKKDL